ncbi:nucleotide-binding domain-containing protein, partial [Basidiobolus meristosporus CBS 931.73]
PHVLIIGGGVSGLTTAWTLRRTGCKVTVLAKQYAQPGAHGKEIVSEIAGALWEWPPAVCGSHGKDTEEQLEALKKWCQVSYIQFKDIANKYGANETGIRQRMSCFLFDLELGPDGLQKKHEIESVCEEFNDDLPHLIQKYKINTDLEKNGYNIVDGYEHLSYVVDPGSYLPWLGRQVEDMGVVLSYGVVEDTLHEEMPYLLKRFKADIVINCTGMASRELCGDNRMKPLRGILLHAKNDGKRFEKIEGCISISQHEVGIGATADEKLKAEEGRFEFIVPRNDDILILGGYAQMGQEALEWDEEKHKYLDKMRTGCVNLYSDLAKAEFTDYYYRAGIRPFRDSPRVGQDEFNPRLFHNYGHGGSGFTLSYGCALDIRQIVKDYFETGFQPTS